MKYKGRFVLTLFSFGSLMALNIYFGAIGQIHLWFVFLSNILVLLSWRLGKHYDEVKYASEIDSLTKAYNRRMAFRIFEKLVKKANKKSQKIALFFIDVDHFKSINDRYGHHAGDEVLRRISATVLQSFKGEKYIVRWGGDEFVMMMPYTDETAVKQRHKQMMYNISTLRDELSIDVTVSVGCSVYPKHGVRLNDLINIADKKMIFAKNMGKTAIGAFRR
ncbi:Diguanylate cyclase DosC [Paenibacillus sp. CECT 9249]|nr:Diguanylate cyclase DosC [Paenibacillus sp. CECT 9249]